MSDELTRRTFLKASMAAGVGLAAGGQVGGAEFKTTLKKAVIIGQPTEEALKPIKDAGFDGVETTAADVAPDAAAKGREAAEKVGVRINSVLRGWMEFNSTDPAKVEASIKSTETALRAAKAYGADAVLLVPCRIGGMPMPDAWAFDIAFDAKTGHLERVAKDAGDKFKAYIEAHDQATDTSREAVRKLIPVAEETGVVIALENVWNNLWVTPATFAHLVASFDSPWVKGYFDIGNHVKYAPPEAFIRAMGPRIAKCHVKDFKLNADGHGGNFCNIRDGSVNWPVVRKALDEVGYSGWMTIEGGSCSLQEHSKRLDLIIAGR